MDGMVVIGILRANSVLIKEGYYVHKLKTNFTFPIEKQSKASSCQSKDKQESGKTCSKKNFQLKEVSDQILDQSFRRNAYLLVFALVLHQGNRSRSLGLIQKNTNRLKTKQPYMSCTTFASYALFIVSYIES